MYFGDSLKDVDKVRDWWARIGCCLMEIFSHSEVSFREKKKSWTYSLHCLPSWPFFFFFPCNVPSSVVWSHPAPLPVCIRGSHMTKPSDTCNTSSALGHILGVRKFFGFLLSLPQIYLQPDAGSPRCWKKMHSDTKLLSEDESILLLLVICSRAESPSG